MPNVDERVCSTSSVWDIGYWGLGNMGFTIRGLDLHRREARGPPPCPLSVRVRASEQARDRQLPNVGATGK